MGFKMGETCDGCDAIAKGLKRYEGKRGEEEDYIGVIKPEDVKKIEDLKKYFKKAVEGSKTRNISNS